MRIHQKCDESVAFSKTSELAIGTVFKLKGYAHTYLKAQVGFINLSDNVWVNGLGSATVDIIYPNARVVLE